MGDGWVPKTTTNFLVERVLKGRIVGNWIQDTESGARPDEIACGGWSYVQANNPLPTIHRRYILFLQERAGQPVPFYGAFDEFPIDDEQIVHAATYEDPRAYAVALPPTPLDEFVRSLP